MGGSVGGSVGSVIGVVGFVAGSVDGSGVASAGRVTCICGGSVGVGFTLGFVIKQIQIPAMAATDARVTHRAGFL